MQLRTILAKDMREALATVRAEMGVEAVIVGSQKTRDGGVMVRAAFDQPADDEELPVESAAASDEAGAESIGTLESEQRATLIRRLRGDLAKPSAAKSFSRPELLALLRNHRAPDSIAHDLAKTAEQSGLSDMTLALACALDRRMKTAPVDIAQPEALLLVGPNGAGKTAVAAKLAAHARLTFRSVKLIATDTAGAGAVARLESFARHIDAPFVVSENAEALAKIVADCTKEHVAAIIDTAGFDPRNGKARSAFAALAKIDGVEAIGIASATGDAEESGEIAGALSTLGARRLIVTGADLVRRLGALVAAATSGTAIAHITSSPYVAAGLESITPLSLARALIASARSADEGSAQ
jgi:flagellar biosynthesis protein FlhF